jgi:hypothetical protein
MFISCSSRLLLLCIASLLVALFVLQALALLTSFKLLPHHLAMSAAVRLLRSSARTSMPACALPRSAGCRALIGMYACRDTTTGNWLGVCA